MLLIFIHFELTLLSDDVQPIDFRDLSCAPSANVSNYSRLLDSKNVVGHENNFVPEKDRLGWLCVALENPFEVFDLAVH